MENPLSSTKTLSSMKNLDNFNFGDQFIADKSPEDESGNANVETKVKSMRQNHVFSSCLDLNLVEEEEDLDRYDVFEAISKWSLKSYVNRLFDNFIDGLIDLVRQILKLQSDPRSKILSRVIKSGGSGRVIVVVLVVAAMNVGALTGVG
nr:hypothetical protein [Tanacetum cinerariifolium]